MRSALRTLVDTLRVICDLLTVSFVVLWIQNRPEFAPWVAASTLAGSVLTRVLKSRCFADSGETLAPTERDRKLAKAGRPAILARVKHDWVEGVLERSLYHVARIDLDMVDRPWNVLLHMPGQGERATDRGIKMSAVYDRMHGAFLILGEPGSGKTTMLLELARDVIARADTDPSRSCSTSPPGATTNSRSPIG